ncbi:hypothetical protein K7711_02840 [Nocardia sp. CA2R105]|uniref:hypothetical protein n=1 Tax=Nocardia coffeae TaxID=2873381 RepID=UPI001CA60E59|nr:hypothetical protein [Nocardia coffeae]MBY8855404.1 hypothetical protein [Nocardia coffeae]
MAAGAVIRMVETFQVVSAPNIKVKNVIRDSVDVLGLMLRRFPQPLLLDVEMSPEVHPPDRFSLRQRF